MFGPGSRLLRRGDYIWGSFVRPSEVDGYIVGVNPGDRKDELGRFSFSATSVDAAMGAATTAAEPWSHTDLEDRLAVARTFGDLLEEDAEALAILLTRETGKPLWESREEVASAVRVARLLVKDGPRWLKPKVLREGAAWSDPRPHGVVGIITPFAFPLLIPTLHGLAALLAGNTVVHKPSKFAPAAGQAVAAHMDRCKLPRGVYNLVKGSGSGVGQRIVTHPGLDALLFAGSFETAMAIRRATFERPELPTLYQCGGKGSAIVLGDADLERASYDLAVSAYATTGQRHNSTARIYIVRDQFDAFCEKFVARAQDLVVGYGFDDGVFMGPLISDNHRNRFRRRGKRLAGDGHTPLLEASSAVVPGRRGFYVQPAVYWVGGAEHLDDEPVGPFVQVYCVTDWEEAAQLHAQQDFRLSTAVFGDPDSATMAELLPRLETGCVNLNRGTIGSSLRLPAVGQGRAANGIPADIELLRFLASPRATLVDRRPFDHSRWVPGTGPLPGAGPDDDDGTSPGSGSGDADAG